MERVYNLVKCWYENGTIDDQDWKEFCEVCLEHLMEDNKKVLDRLKIVQYNKYVNKRKKELKNAIIYLVCCYECYQCYYSDR